MTRILIDKTKRPSKDLLLESISRMDSINLAIALFSNLLEIPYPVETTSDNKKQASVSNLYKKVDTPIEIVELTVFDQKHKDQF